MTPAVNLVKRCFLWGFGVHPSAEGATITKSRRFCQPGFFSARSLLRKFFWPNEEKLCPPTHRSSGKVRFQAGRFNVFSFMTTCCCGRDCSVFWRMSRTWKWLRKRVMRPKRCKGCLSIVRMSSSWMRKHLTCRLRMPRSCCCESRRRARFCS